MSTCLSDARIQAVADDAAAPEEYAHVARCAECRAKVAGAQQAIRAFGAAMTGNAPPSLERRIAAALNQAVASPRRGATTFAPARPQPWLRPAWLSLAGAVAAAALIALVVLPSLDTSSRLSAAEILNRSIATLAPSGTELLEYDLAVSMPVSWPITSGTYRIEQVIEHEGAGRWRLSRFDAAGMLLNGISEDPSAGRRRAFLRVDGHGYAFEFDTSPDAEVRLGAMQRQYAEAAMRVIQAAAGQIVITEEDATGKRFVIELPDSASAPRQAGPALLWDLAGARVVIDAADYHVRELIARGIYMGEPISISYRLLRREGRPSSQVAPSEFELPIDDGAMTIRAQGTAHPPQDILMALLREVGRARQ
jgi:hypothetical protein